VTTVLEYTVVGYVPQTYELTPAALTVGYDTQLGERGSVAPAEPIAITVESVLTDSRDQSLRPIRPPVALAEPLTALISPALPAALASVVLALLLIYARNKRRRAALQAATAEDRARHALEAAATALSGARPDYLSFYTQIDAATRRYLAERTDLPSLTATTRELQVHLSGNGTDQEQAALIVHLLRSCDMARWAHEFDGLAAAHTSLDQAYLLIDSVSGNGYVRSSAIDSRSAEKASS
jgi:hypothetical protein